MRREEAARRRHDAGLTYEVEVADLESQAKSHRSADLKFQTQNAKTHLPSGTNAYTVHIVNHDLGDTDDWFGGEITFGAPTPPVPPSGVETWTLTCNGRTTQVEVDRGGVEDIDEACAAAARRASSIGRAAFAPPAPRGS